MQGNLTGWLNFDLECDRCGTSYTIAERSLDWLKKKLKTLGFHVGVNVEITQCPKCKETQ